MTLSKLKRLAAKLAITAVQLTPPDAYPASFWDDDYDGIKAVLKKLKLKWTIVGRYTRVVKVYRLNVILKRRSGLSCNPPTKDVDTWLLKHIIDTVEFRLPDGNVWVVQPVALRDSSNKAKSYRHFNKLRVIDVNVNDLDIHMGNVGWYNGKPVLIDW